MYLYFRTDGQVVMRSEELQTFANLQRKKITPTEEQQEKIKAGWTMKVKDTKLVFEKPTHIETQESITDFKAQIDNAKTVDDLKTIINKLI